MEYFINAVKHNYANFNGRETRKSYWMFVLVYIAIYIVAVILDGLIGIQLISIILALGLLIPSISIAARRLHDTGRSGWWQLIGLIPLLGAIILIVFLVQDSKPDNKYGANPKGPLT